MAKLKRTTKRTLLIAVILVALLTGAFTAVYVINTKQLKAVYEEELKISKGALEENTRQLYVAAKDIKVGDIIGTSDVSAISAISSVDPSQYFTSGDIGSKALVNITAESVIMSSMITYDDYEDTARESQFGVFLLNSNLNNGDFVDIRIRYKNGEDYVVLSQKKVKNISLKNAICYLDMTEEELQLTSSAIVDAGIYDAVLYTTTYLQPGVQQPSTVTYQPNANVLKAIFDNPNIIEVTTQKLSAMAREEMESRLLAYEEEQKEGSQAAGNLNEVPSINGVGNVDSSVSANIPDESIDGSVEDSNSNDSNVD